MSILDRTVVDSLQVTRQPNSIVIDKNEKLWVLSDGGNMDKPDLQEHASLMRIDHTNMTIEKQMQFSDKNLSPTHLQLNGEGDSLFYIAGGWSPMAEGGVFAMSVYDNDLPQNPLIPQNNRLFYGMAIDKQNHLIYVSNAIDYVQNGYVFRYENSALMIDSFQVGISPGSFCFKRK